MKFTFLSWNVRHFKGTDEQRLKDVDKIISDLSPDVFGLIEFQAKKLMRKLMFNNFPEYDFAVTDSKNGVEITAGWKRNKFKQAIWTQKREFLNNNLNMRPGGLLSVNCENKFYNLLFLHTDSGTGTKDYENRQEMFKKIWKMNQSLKAISNTGEPNLIALGDLNTMGKGTMLTGEDEIEELSFDADKNEMILLSKDFNDTWHQWGKGPWGNRRKLEVSELSTALKSNLDHVIASKELNFSLIGANNSTITVNGWNQLDGNERIDFLREISDHSAIFGEIEL